MLFIWAGRVWAIVVAALLRELYLAIVNLQFLVRYFSFSRWRLWILTYCGIWHLMALWKFTGVLFIPWRQRQHVPPKRRCIYARLYGVTFWKTVTLFYSQFMDFDFLVQIYTNGNFWISRRSCNKLSMRKNGLRLIHIVVCLTTGPKPLLKRALHILRSRASSFQWEYPFPSLRSSSSFLRLLPRLVTYIPPFVFPSITRCRRQFLRKMWPIQLVFRLRISCRIFLSSLTLNNTSFLTWSVQLIFSILLQHHISKLSRCLWSTA